MTVKERRTLRLESRVKRSSLPQNFNRGLITLSDCTHQVHKFNYKDTFRPERKELNSKYHLALK